MIPAKELTGEFVSRGIPGERIVPLGIPVGRQFWQQMSRDEARMRLGLDPQANYILVAGVPLIHITPIPGCETRNMTFFEKHGMCYAVRSPKTQLTAACDMLLDPGRQREMKENQHKIISADAAAAICRLIEQTQPHSTIKLPYRHIGQRDGCRA